ncbi:hypothetical protein RND81_02G242300 [Saponaria officinalis]|uniref:Transmembrane protein n=1 Tax=Saponaria officinalis TaxID=3572 RepID=A0AAW1MZA6_SAPOF
MANSQMKSYVVVACLIMMVVLVSAHNGVDHSKEHHSPTPSPLPKDNAAGSLSTVPALIIGIAAFAFSLARV